MAHISSDVCIDLSGDTFRYEDSLHFYGHCRYTVQFIYIIRLSTAYANLNVIYET